MSRIRITSLALACPAVAIALLVASAGVAHAGCPAGIVDPVATLPVDGATGVPTDAHLKIFRSQLACDDGSSFKLTKGDVVVPLYSDEGVVGRGFTKMVDGYPRTPLDPNTTYVLTVTPTRSTALSPNATLSFTTGAGLAPAVVTTAAVTLDNVVWSAPVSSTAGSTGTPNRVYRATVSVHVTVADPGGLSVVHLLASDEAGRSLSDFASPVSVDGDIAASYPLGGGTDMKTDATFQWLGKSGLCLSAVIEDSAGRYSPVSPVACAGGVSGDVTAPSPAPVDPDLPLPGEGFDRSSCAFGGGAPRDGVCLIAGLGLVALGASARRRRRVNARRGV